MLKFVKLKNYKEVLWFFFKPYKFQSMGVFCLMALAGALEAFNLLAIYPIINYGLALENQSRALQFLDSLVVSLGDDNLFLSACVLLLIASFLAVLAKVAYHVFSNLLIKNIVGDHQKKIFQKFLNAEYKYFVRSQQGKLIYAGTTATTRMANNIVYTLRLVNSLITCTFYAVMLTVLAWQGMILITFIGILYMVFTKVILQKVINRYAHLNVEEERKKNVILNEFITGIKPIKAFNNNRYWQGRYDQTVERSVMFNFKVLIGHIMPDIFLKFTFFVTFALIGIFMHMRLSGQILPVLPLLATFTMVASRLFPYVGLIGFDIMAIARVMPDTKIVYDLLNKDIEDHRDGTLVADTFRDCVRLNNVFFRYKGMDEDLLKGVSLSIKKGEMTAIVGHSGSGKSTLVSLLLKLYDVDKGNITVDGIDLKTLSKKSYLTQIGYVSQEIFLFNGTIKDNIRFGDQESTDEDIIQAAQLANAHEFIIDTENGYDSLVGDAGVKLSGGQRQRIAIARAMLRQPKIIILDEATSSLDNISEKAVQEAIFKVSQRTTVVVIAHRLSTVQKADKIIVFENGEVQEEGKHDELLAGKNRYFELYTAS